LERLSYDGLSEISHRRAEVANGDEPSLHDFRHTFPLSLLGKGIDVFTLAKLMGHEGITILQRYLKQTYQDTELTYQGAGPVDNSELFLQV
jgi:site-specific recombinase XerD